MFVSPPSVAEALTWYRLRFRTSFQAAPRRSLHVRLVFPRGEARACSPQEDLEPGERTEWKKWAWFEALSKSVHTGMSPSRSRMVVDIETHEVSAPRAHRPITPCDQMQRSHHGIRRDHHTSHETRMVQD